MKYVLGAIVGVLLGGCTTTPKYIEGPNKGITCPFQSTSPLPWLHVAPTDRALAFKEVDFTSVSNQIHFDMGSQAHWKLFTNIHLVIVDYTILPSEAAQQNAAPDTNQPSASQAAGDKNAAPVANAKLISRPQRYFLTMSFYEFGKRPPNSPVFEVIASMRASTVPPHEAIRLMAQDIIEEYHVLSKVSVPVPQKKINLNLD